MSLLGQVYRTTPYPLRQLYWYGKSVLQPIPLRYGRDFFQTYAFLNQSQWWSREEIENYQSRELQRLVHHAYTYIPYYRDTWKKHHIEPDKILSVTDIERLPLLTKEDIRDNADKLLDPSIPKSELEYVTTGGSTGIPLGFYIAKKTNNVRMAYEWRNWHWANYNYNDRCVNLRGAVIERQVNGRRAWKEYDPFEKLLILSTYDLREDLLDEYIQTLEYFKPKVIRGYPSALTILAKYLKDKNISLNKDRYLQTISTTSESLYPDQRSLIETYFNAPVFDKYGNTEQVTIIGQCELRDGYHEAMEYGITEIRDNKNRLLDQPGQCGEIIGTAFTNYAMPFIRYKTGDVAELGPDKCDCGRHLRKFSRLAGRLQELVQTSKGNLISMTAINMHSDVFDRVRQFQFYQDTPGKVTINIIKAPEYSERDTDFITQELKKKFGPDMHLSLKFVTDIPLTKRGKHKFLIQKLPIGSE